MLIPPRLPCGTKGLWQALWPHVGPCHPPELLGASHPKGRQRYNRSQPPLVAKIPRAFEFCLEALDKAATAD